MIKENNLSKKILYEPETPFYEKLPIPAMTYAIYLVKKLLRKLNLPKSITFLEIGCGTGQFLFEMANRGYKGWGVDLGEYSVTKSKEKVRNFQIDVYQMDFMKINRSFDLIFAFSVFEHIKDDDKAFDKVYDMLNENGYFIFSVPGRKDLFEDVDRGYGHFRRYERDEIVAKLNQVGFKIHTIWSWGPKFIPKLYRCAIKKESDVNVNLSTEEKTKISAYHAAGEFFVRKIFPIYSKLFFLYKIQNLFLNCNFLNCNYLVMCQKILDNSQRGEYNLKRLHSKVFDPEKSMIKKYQELVIGDYNLISLLKFELIFTTFSWIPGALGLLLRKYFYKYLFKEVGVNVIFGKNINITHPNKIKIGKNCLISDNCSLDARGEGGEISIGNNVQIARNTLLQSNGGFIEIGDNASIGSSSYILSVSTEVKLGENAITAAYCYIIGGANYGFNRLDIPIMFQAKFGKGIVIEDDVWLGAGVYVLDGNNIGRGSVIGAGSVVTKDIPPYSVAFGVPAKVVKKRGKDWGKVSSTL